MTHVMTALQRNIVFLATVFVASLIALVLALPGFAYAAMLTQTLDIGDSNNDVTSLQTYLAMNASYYPSGLVTGYYGPLTAAGVEKFQTAQGIVTSGTPATTGYGRVGPTTLARINFLMGETSANPGSNVSWDTVPVLSVPKVQITNTTATFTWTTNEPTLGEVYWSQAPIVSNEATGPRQTPYVSGSLATDAGGYQTNHTVTVSNLEANILYHYLVRGIDSAGNMSMTLPSSFRTNN